MKKTKLLKAVAYARYSSDNQREESIEAQLKAIKEHCKRNGYLLVKVYSDEAKSATTDKRPGFQQMIAESALGLFDVVIIHKINRFARDRYDSAFYKRKLKMNNVRLESVVEKIDDSPESIILESVLEGMAEYFSKDLAREVRKGQSTNADKAIHNGGRPPYGLKVNKENQKYEIDESRYKAVQIYFEGIAAGISLPTIADKINELGFRTYTGNKFGRNSFDGWAYNRKYKGDYTWDVAQAKSEGGSRNNHAKKPLEMQTIIPGVIPAIISEELWNKVNIIMKERKHSGGRMKAKTVYLLTGKVFCGKCNSPYTGQAYPSRKNYYAYYRCSERCGNKNIRKEDLEEVVIDHVINTCFTPSAMNNIAVRVKALYKKRHESVDNEIEPIKKEINDIDKKLNNWIDALGEGLLDKNVLANKIREANEKKSFLEAELSRIMLIKSTNMIDDKFIIDALEIKKHQLFSDDEDERKQVLQEYVDKVVIYNDGNNDNFKLDITVRLFNGGDELTLLESLTIIK